MDIYTGTPAGAGTSEDVHLTINGAGNVSRTLEADNDAYVSPDRKRESSTEKKRDTFGPDKFERNQ